MAALKWDETGKRYLETGVSKGILFVQNSDGSYKDGVAWSGLTSVSLSPDGAEANDFWADNIKYASIRSTETLGGTIEAYQSPEEFDQCDGWGIPSDGIKIGQQNRNPFAFCYRSEKKNDTQSEGDDGYIIHIVYNATASPSERSYETINDSPDAITLSWEFDTTPITVSGYKVTALVEIDSTRVDATKLATFEKKLYGDDSTESTLMTPDEIITMFAA